MCGRNVNLTVCTTVKCVCVSINRLVLPTSQTGLTSMRPCGLQRVNKSINNLEIKELQSVRPGRCCVLSTLNRVTQDYQSDPQTAPFLLFLHLWQNSANKYMSRTRFPRIKAIRFLGR